MGQSSDLPVQQKDGVVNQLSEVLLELGGQLANRHISHLFSAVIEEPILVGKQMAVFEPDPHILIARENRADVSRRWVVKANPMPPRIHLLRCIRHRRSDEITQIQGEADDLRGVVVEDVLDQWVGGQTETSRPRSAKRVNSGRKVISTLPVEPARCLAMITSARPLVSWASGW